VKPQIQQAQADAEQAAKIATEAKAEAEDSKKTIETATAEAKRQLGSATALAKNVGALSDRMSGLEQQTSSQINNSSHRVEARVAELDQRIDVATKNIAEQQNKLASTDELVKALFSKGITEYFSTTDNGSVVAIIPRTNGVSVFLLLKSAPIFQTTEVKWRVFSQPRGSYSVTNNILFFNWGESAENLKQYPLEVTYVPDPTAKIAAFKTLSVKGNSVFADETKLMDLPPNK
jgi:Zn-dependent metalloprotease